MNCKISIDINKGKEDIKVEKYGATIAVNMISSGEFFNEDTLQMEQGAPETFNNIFKKETPEYILKSFYLTNNTDNLNDAPLRKKLSDKSIDRFIKYHLHTNISVLNRVNGIFSKIGKIHSSVVSEHAPLIVEDENFDPATDKSRDYIVLSSTIIKKIEMSIDKSIKGDLRKKEFNETLKIFIASAFQRGYSIHVKQPMNGMFVSLGSRIFNRLNSGRSSRYVSSYQRANADAHIIFSNSVEKLVRSFDTSVYVKEKKDITPIKSSSILNTFLNEEDRILLNKF